MRRLILAGKWHLQLSNRAVRHSDAKQGLLQSINTQSHLQPDRWPRRSSTSVNCDEYCSYGHVCLHGSESCGCSLQASLHS